MKVLELTSNKTLMAQFSCKILATPFSTTSAVVQNNERYSPSKWKLENAHFGRSLTSYTLRWMSPSKMALK